MSTRFKLLLALPLLGFAALLALLGAGLGTDPSVLPSALLDKPLPAFSAERLEEAGDRVVETDLAGDVALLNVWATWCPTCYAEHEFLRTLKDQGVTIYGVNYKDERSAALRWLDELGDPYRLNIYDEDGQLGIDLGVYGAPETYLLDERGMIRYRHVGELNDRVWRRDFLPRIDALRAELSG